MKTMTKMLLLVLGLGITALFSGNDLLANKKGCRGWHNKSHEGHLEKMTKKLDLSDDQQTALKKIFDEKKEKMEDLQKEIQALQSSSHDQMKALFSEKQLKKFEKMKSKKHKKYKKHKKKGKRGKACKCAKCSWSEE